MQRVSTEWIKHKYIVKTLIAPFLSDANEVFLWIALNFPFSWPWPGREEQSISCLDTDTYYTPCMIWDTGAYYTLCFHFQNSGTDATTDKCNKSSTEDDDYKKRQIENSDKRRWCRGSAVRLVNSERWWWEKPALTEAYWKLGGKREEPYTKHTTRNGKTFELKICEKWNDMKIWAGICQWCKGREHIKCSEMVVERVCSWAEESWTNKQLLQWQSKEMAHVC